MPITVGPGLRQHLTDNQDEPIYDHREGTTQNQDGSSFQWETVWGRKGWYLSSDATGQWDNVGPFGAAE